MRVISGKLKGRKVATSKKMQARPTTGRTREAIFNILGSGKFIIDGKSILEDSVIIEPFCGTASLSIEAISRGARFSYIVDIDQQVLKLANQTINHIGITDQIKILRSDGTKLPRAIEKCDIAFLDPPYGENLAIKSLLSLYENGWLKDTAVIILETGRREDLVIPENFKLIDERTYGKAKVRFLQLSSDQL